MIININSSNNRLDLLQHSRKHNIFVHLKVNTLYLTENMEILPNLIMYQG